MLTLFFEGRAFTATPEKPLGQEAIGNPALICFTENLLSESTMSAIARQAASPMTTFIALTGRDGTYALRYYSPNGSEVDLCGHATVVSTFFIKNFVEDTASYAFALNPTFHSAGFPLQGVASSGAVGIQARAYASKQVDLGIALDCIASALGIEVEDIRAVYETELCDFVFILRDNVVMRTAQPDFDEIINLGKTTLPHRTMVLSADSDEDGFDYEARVFVPLLGINEDIACGSVNCSLAPIWAGVTGKSHLKMFSYAPNESGETIVGGVQDISIDGERLTIRSNVRPVWHRLISCYDADALIGDKTFHSLMQKVSKAPAVRILDHKVGFVREGNGQVVSTQS